MSVIKDYSNYDVIKQQCLKLQNLDETISKIILFEIKNYYEVWDEKIIRYNAGGRRVYISHAKRLLTQITEWRAVTYQRTIFKYYNRFNKCQFGLGGYQYIPLLDL